MARIEDYEFDDIFWDIKRVPTSVDLRKKYKDEFKEVWPNLIRSQEKEVNRRIRYIIFLYDHKSPLVRKIKNIDERRDYAAKLAGYNIANVPEELKRNVIDGKEPSLVLSIYNFVKYRNPMKFTELVIYENNFWDYSKILLSPPKKQANHEVTEAEVKRRKALRVEIKNIQEDIEALQYELFSGDKEIIPIVREVRRMQTTPEAMALPA